MENNIIETGVEQATEVVFDSGKKDMKIVAGVIGVLATIGVGLAIKSIIRKRKAKNMELPLTPPENVIDIETE